MRDRSHGMPLTVVVTGVVVLASCGSEARERTSDIAGWMVETRRSIGGDDVAPLCLRFDAEVAGELVEYVSPESQRTLTVIEVEADDATLDELERVFDDVGQCGSDSIEVERLTESPTATVWRVQLVDSASSAEPEMLSFIRTSERSTIVAGDEAAWDELGGLQAWTP
ncbi:MAG: hypothetical protein HRT86_15020 [Ilumatobacteraceae bacterium]|nr:hypothetical protein [Ilumatobacteraceae bacterium]